MQFELAPNRRPGAAKFLSSVRKLDPPDKWFHHAERRPSGRAVLAGVMPTPDSGKNALVQRLNRPHVFGSSSPASRCDELLISLPNLWSGLFSVSVQLFQDHVVGQACPRSSHFG